MVSQAIKGADQPQAQWYWKSNSDPWSTNGNEEWTRYSDIESAIIEEAFNQKNKIKLAELDNYSINLNDNIQISKSDQNKQRQIKRVLTSRNESQGLREERFFLTPELSKTFTDHWGKEAYIFLSHWKENKELSDAEIVEQAANGITIEGKKLGQHCDRQLPPSNQQSCDESEMSSGAMKHLGDRQLEMDEYSAGAGHADSNSSIAASSLSQL
ncbi:unnamed protein product [Didymodactylos carnosus]|uniref:WWE domain-containing protein n=1 Tax=Didymodactylos carnosus TaxID=1234261 RepID=A0A8S2DTC0_9BILA|nr:unnamed protein product [Didymodactylos carnosus]CAF3772809.1 unnamed protein product [Didymodactylos carnosus]